ncbi:ribbon-helix-helix protein, CopG family [Loktanella salsilacus]|uniref:ribbon-helix-helix protein, CopG family n=1 Tax=Loktanella salsilacus TaxID=195913 RepID=UPI003703B0FF
MAGRGRPRSADTKPVMVRMTDDLVDKIDEARKLQSDLPTRPEMIRRMLQEWLARDDADRVS